MAEGSLSDIIGVRDEVVKKACALALKADKSPEKSYVLEKIKVSSESVNIFGFPASWHVADFYASNGKPFGETKINEQFPALRSVGNDEAALVNEASLTRFELVMSNSTLKTEVSKAMTEGKQIVFTGHSSGASVANLLTFWTLEEYLNPNKKNQHYKPPICITFGAPLIGNHIFSHATNRENWSRYFVHFVLRFDIVPRILLAPFTSIERMFATILQLFATSPRTSRLSALDRTRAGTASEFYTTVMRNAATVTSHAACILKGSTNLLLETVTNFVDLSPYKPFGTFVFCAGDGQLTVIRNADAVLQILFHSAQTSDLSQVSDVANNSILQHQIQNYEAELQESLEMQNVVCLDQLEKLPLSADGSNSEVVKALDGLGLNPKARLCLRAAGELQKQKQKNEKKISDEIDAKALPSMKLLEEYKAQCAVIRGYFDAFKVQKEPRDFQANVKRLVLAGARPKRYRYTQRWLEHANRTPKAGISESTFWAEVQELCSWTSNKKAFEDVEDRVVQLEKNIKGWIEKAEMNKDVLLRDPTFVNLWENLPKEHKATSCIAHIL
ncbi:defense response, partial [Stylosanthes scabra]|nr:defense response [Stylosanthes scabra]